MATRVCYLRKGVFYLPFGTEAEAGFYLSNDPIARPQVKDTSEVQRALREELAREMPIVPTPPRDAKMSHMLEHAGVRSWKAFERDAVCWTITLYRGIWKIKRNMRVGTPHDAGAVIEFPAGTTSHEVADRMVQVVQDKARELGQL